MNRRTIQDRAIGQLAKRMAVNCVRNTQLEKLHAGITPVSKTGDFSDVSITDSEGNTIPWTEASFITQAEMKDLMITVVNRLYTVLMKGEDPEVADLLTLHDASTRAWNAPQIDTGMLEYLKHLDAMAKESEAAKALIEDTSEGAT